jgi:hypothetical protein
MERITALFAMIIKQTMGATYAKCFFEKQLRRAALTHNLAMKYGML